MTSCKRAPLTTAYVYDFHFFSALDIWKIYILLHEQLLKKKQTKHKKENALPNIITSTMLAALNISFVQTS